MSSILVQPIGFSLTAAENETVLEAALRHGYFFPHLCQMGVCGTCKGKVLQGDVDFVREVTGLTQNERLAGEVLFCSVKAASDLVIEVNDFGNMADMSAKECGYDVIEVKSFSDQITQLLLRPENRSHLVYQAGQYLEVMHADGSASPLSIATAPQENFQIELHLSHPSDNLPAQAILRMIAIEKKLRIRGPYGVCTAGKLYGDRPIIFLARGTGFAPIKAMIEELIKFKKYPRMHFFWSVSSPDEFYFSDLLAEWMREIKNFSFTPVLSRPYAGWNGKTGRLQDVILSEYPDMTRALVYASGPESMVREVWGILQQAGLMRERFFSDWVMQ